VLTLSGNTALTLSTGNYLLNGINISSNATLSVTGQVGLFVEGPINVTGSGNVINGASGDTENLVIFSSSSQAVTISGNSMVGAYLYAPYATVNITANCQFGGHIFASIINVTQNATVASGHLVPAMWGLTPGSSQLHANAAFELGEVYAFPNPAKGGTGTTIHVEAGLAQGLDIRIYDISGRLIRSESLSAAPQLIDDHSGRGAQYAFEWKWDVSGVPSGVYVYVVTAHMSGHSDLRTMKKVAVIK
jgi:hypothetical protein